MSFVERKEGIRFILRVECRTKVKKEVVVDFIGDDYFFRGAIEEERRENSLDLRKNKSVVFKM